MTRADATWSWKEREGLVSLIVGDTCKEKGVSVREKAVWVGFFSLFLCLCVSVFVSLSLVVSISLLPYFSYLLIRPFLMDRKQST